MSIELVTNSLKKFIETDVAEAVCLKGRWGVGKTFSWDTLVKESSEQKKVALPFYSYVSLFGLSSIDELRQSIFENSDLTNGGHVDLQIKLMNYGRNALTTANKIRQLATIPYAENYIKNLNGGFRAIFSEAIKNTIVCIDDLERRGKNFPIDDILGVISQLKEKKRCKVLLIYNEDAICDEDKSAIQIHFEKVFDATLNFEPTAAECVSIGLPGDEDIHEQIRANCVNLNIANIRVIKKIARLAFQLNEILSSYDAEYRKSVIRSLTVLAWSEYSPSDAPDIEYLKHKREKQAFGAQSDHFTQKEVEWGQILDRYGFSHCDELDLTLIEGIKRGFFNDTLIMEHAEKQQREFSATQGSDSLHEAWRLFHDSFNDNPNEVITQIFTVSKKNIKQVNIGTLNGTLSLFKELGEECKASELLDIYVSKRRQEEGLFDLSEYPFASEITDPDLIERFASIADEVKRATQPSLFDACKRVSGGSYSSPDLETLATASADDFRRLFKSLRGEDLRNAVAGALFFKNVVNATAEQTAITAKAAAALRSIAEESPLNQRRVRRYGVNLD